MIQLENDKTPKTGGARRVVAIALSLFALLPLAIGLRWLQVFVLTDYRTHHRPIIIPLAICTLIFSAVLFSEAFRLWRLR